MATVDPNSDRPLKNFDRFLADEKRIREHPELLTGDNIEDMTPEEIAISDRVFDSFTPEQWARWRAQRKARLEEERENSEKP